MTAWKELLLREGLAPASVNAVLAAANRFLAWAGALEFRVKALRLRRHLIARAFYQNCRDIAQLVHSARHSGRSCTIRTAT